ncbi:response regulator [Parvularcula lutaonensis]|uniref:Response regulator n=1 Tax=Parvularcula lutaonensis TaxID=491923 RepID=A0ABV7MBK9_9PROT|nr:response regulator [Parvularcula lutaonensis]GGY44642.1 DNA-binding response regulator [Parvularcula lutaonensis]
MVQTAETLAGHDTPHVLVVDDDEGIRKLLARYLRENGFLASAVESAAHADALMKTIAFDALVIDVMMPGEDGFSMTERLRARSAVPILLLTARGEPEDRIRGLEAGANDYLPKPFEPRELVLRLRGLLQRTALPPKDERVRFGPFAFDPARGELTNDGERVKLTDAELHLLRTLAAKPGAPIPRTVLAQKELGVFDRSIDVQVTRLRRKIEEDPRSPRYLKTVRGVGYALMTD